MAPVYLGLGSNLGDRSAYLSRAVDAIAALPGTRLIARSPVYENPPMGPQNQGHFLNLAVRIETTLKPQDLLQNLQGIETGLGRPAPSGRRHWGPREIDIDLLLYGDQAIDRPGLTVPHPGMHQRWFVLRPLADLAPGLRHPVLGRTIAELLSDVEAPAAQGAPA